MIYMLKKLINFSFSKSKDVVFTGIQPTGNLHIGNYLGSIKNILKLQELDSQLYLCVVDYHALTNKFNKDHSQISYSGKLNQDTLQMFSILLACGVNPNKTNIFIQSHVPQHAQLCWILGCISPHFWLNSMIQYKQKKQKNNNPSLGLYSYPVLMAADIILYGATKVPVGSDQIQHLELTHKIIDRFNSLFGDVFPKPSYISSEVPRVMSLIDGSKKMSKSNSKDMSRINLVDSDELIRQKISRAKTDSINELYSDKERVQVSNLISLFAAFQNMSVDEANAKIKDMRIKQFKQLLSESLIRTVSPLREKLFYYKKNPEQVKRVIDVSKEKVRKDAEENMKQIKKIMQMYI